MNQFILQSQLGKEDIIQPPSRRNTGCERGYQRDEWLCEAYMGQKAWNEESCFLGKNTWWLGGTKYTVSKYCAFLHVIRTATQGGNWELPNQQ